VDSFFIFVAVFLLLSRLIGWLFFTAPVYFNAIDFV
jgi:hypothetical protein